MLWFLVSVGIVQLLLGIAVIFLHNEIKKLRYDFENHGHCNNLGR